jgi:hypothetical protein
MRRAAFSDGEFAILLTLWMMFAFHVGEVIAR